MVILSQSSETLRALPLCPEGRTPERWLRSHPGFPRADAEYDSAVSGL